MMRLVGKHTLSFAMPESLAKYIDERVESGGYGNRSEFIRDLIRRDQREQAKAKLRALVEAGLASGTPEALGDTYWSELRRVASGRIQ
jgi:antitoxin ParD1/3/4